LTCYIEIESEGPIIDSEKYLLEFTAASSDIFYKLPPIRITVEYGATLETVFNNFLVFKCKNGDSYQLINRDSYTKVFEFDIP
jgi:hypothetical protein